MRAVLVLPFLLALTACATRPIAATNAAPVPTERILAGYADFSSATAEKVKVIVVRDPGLLGAASPAKLSIDGVPIATLRTKERLEFYLIPGSHIFGVEPSPRLWGTVTEQSFEIKPDKIYFFRISLTSGDAFLIQPSTQI